MKSGSHPAIKTEVEDISDADQPPKCCPQCKSEDFSRYSYYYRTLQKLGSPHIARRIQFESITWRCNQCETSFAIHNSEINSQLIWNI
jgi:ribosomal protein L37AE/L43A